MKQLFILIIILSLSSTSVFAVDFVPNKLTLSASDMLQYNFDGSNLEIPVAVNGTPALVVFCLFTKDKASEIVNVQNGNLGWHYVNKIDTCIYYSSGTSLDIGKNTISWNGTDQFGDAVPSGEYTYYLWGFDHVNQRVKVMEGKIPQFDSGIIEYDQDGNPMANPIYYANWWRWSLGNDPEDEGLRETTEIEAPGGYSKKNHSHVDPFDHSYLYAPMHNKDAMTGGIFRYQWVPNGVSVLDTAWGEDGAVTWSQPDFYHMGATGDNNYVYITSNTYKEDDVINDLRVVSYEGSLETIIDYSYFWGDLDDLNAGGQANGGPDLMYQRGDVIYLGCHCSSIHQAVNPVRGLEDEEDFVVYLNQNGDYILDYNFNEDSPKPWVNNDFNAGVESYSFIADTNMFGMECIYDLGAVSFGLLAPDGTGIDHFAFAGESANGKFGFDICDNGSAFDGVYSTKGEVQDKGWEGAVSNNTWYSGQDSIMGIISSIVAVEDDAPAAFSVAQNLPNPFNPSTTISFTITDAGNVTVDVFNVAGQKVDTISNEYRNAGSHSVTWDASEFSAGIYFYTVKTGNFTRTMKMTLLK